MRRAAGPAAAAAWAGCTELRIRNSELRIPAPNSKGPVSSRSPGLFFFRLLTYLAYLTNPTHLPSSAA